MELVAWLEGVDGEAEEITVQGRKLLDICRALPEGAELKISREGERITVRSGRSRFVLATLPASDFQSTSSEDLKYVQAYTLVHYFLNADGGQWRSRFFDYLRGAWKGRGSASDLEHAIGQDLDAIDKAWNAWVQERAK